MSTILCREDFELELTFTKIYKENRNVHRAVREARCLAWQLPRIILDMDYDDLVPGGCHYGAVGFSSQIGGFLYYSHEEKIKAEIKKSGHRTEYCGELEEMRQFWKKENSKDCLRSRYSERQLLAMPTDDWEGEKAISYPLYRIAGGILDFGKLLTLGIPGLMELIKKKKAETDEEEAKGLYEGMEISLETLKTVIAMYQNRAAGKAGELQEKLQFADSKIEGYEKLVSDYKRMRAVEGAMASIREERPRHLLEAVELFWMYVLVSEVRNYGRIDDYLGSFYAEDIDSGYLSEEEADEIILKLWERMGKRRTITDGRIFIGGRGRKEEGKADRLAKSCIRATRKLKNPDPQLSLRFYEGMDEDLMQLAYEAIWEGCTYPILYQDEVVIQDVCKAFRLPEEAAVSYVPYGCGEYVIDHQSFGTPSGVINLMKGLELFLHSPGDTGEPDAEYLTGEVGKKRLEVLRAAAGVTKYAEEYDDFQEFYEEFMKWISFHIEVMAEQEKMEYDFAGEVCSFPFLSLLYDDCLERGRGLFSGGIRYLGGTLESYGNVNTADSLTAIKSLVFEKKELDFQTLKEALRTDFSENELLRARLLRCPKFGNDEEMPDQMMGRLHRDVCLKARDQAKRVGLHSYLIVVINNSANTSLGLLTGAGADGRHAKASLANANSPQAGGDRNGVTAVLNSMRKVESHIHAGAVQNIKFSKETCQRYQKETRFVIETYFAQGGAQLMITVVGKEDLERALKKPEEYRGLLVRVGGFSARFVELSKEVQMDILSRTCY